MSALLTVHGVYVLNNSDLPPYHGVMVGCRSWFQSLAYTLIIPRYKFEFHFYHSFRGKFICKRSTAEM